MELQTLKEQVISRLEGREQPGEGLLSSCCTEAINRMMHYLNREDLPDELLPCAAALTIDLLRISGGTDSMAAGVRMGDTSVDFSDEGFEKRSREALCSYRTDLLPYRRMRW